MNTIAEWHFEYNSGSVFLCIHEAYIGENFSHLTSMDQKFERTRALRELLGVIHLILVDSLDGSWHRAYRSMPNMTLIFDRRGMPVYKRLDSHQQGRECDRIS